MAWDEMNAFLGSSEDPKFLFYLVVSLVFLKRCFVVSLSYVL